MKTGSLLLALAVSCGLFINRCPANTSSWTKADLPWGYWHALACSGDGKVLITANAVSTTQGAIYVSTNSGATWMLTSAPAAIWTSVAASEDGSWLFAAAGGDFGRDRIYFSTNSGVNWAVSSAPVTNWNSIACSSDGTKLVAAAAGPCSYGPIFLTTDAGATWTTADLPAMNWWSVASSTDGAKLAAASVENGVYLSTNSGASWRRIVLTNSWVRTVTISADGRRLAAAAVFGPLYVSADAGDTWTSITNVPEEQSSIASSADGTELVLWSLLPLPYNHYASGIYFSTDGGTAWSTNQWPYVDSGWNSTALLACSADGGTMAVSLGNDGVFIWQAPPPSAPVAVTLPAMGTNGDFVLPGVVNPNRRETWAWFDWGTSPAFGNGIAPVAAGNGWNDVPLSTALSGFPPGVAVYFRIAAANDFGFSIGRPLIYQAPLITLLGDNPLYVIDGDSYPDPGSAVYALPVAIATGEHYSLALKADRTVAGWGNAPAIPPELANVVTIAAGFNHGLALKNDGTVAAWGGDDHGETNVPANLDHVVAISAGRAFNLALKSDGTVVGWGLGATNHPVYDGINMGQAMPPEGLSNVVAIAAGYDSSLALKSDGTIVGWGNPAYGGITPPAGLSNVVAISAGAAFGLALKADGRVVAWGFSEANQTNVPADLTNVAAIAAGTYHSLALKADGTVVTWGMNLCGEANPPAGLSNVVAITAGSYHSLALKADGTVVGWGRGAFGETVAPTNLIDSLGAADVAGVGQGNTPGTYFSTYTAINPQGGVAKATRTVIMLGARDVKQRVLAEMTAMATGSAGHGRNLDLAIGRLNHALATNLWVNDISLTEGGGRNVFAEEAMAVHQLDHLLKQEDNVISTTVVHGWEENLAKSARLLAMTAIQTRALGAFGGHFIVPPFVMDQMDKGDHALAAQQYANAILHYENAWRQMMHWSPKVYPWP